MLRRRGDGAVCGSFDWRQPEHGDLILPQTAFFRKLREVIAQRLDEEAPELLGGEVEIRGGDR